MIHDPPFPESIRLAVALLDLAFEISADNDSEDVGESKDANAKTTCPKIRMKGWASVMGKVEGLERVRRDWD